jgi:ComF family protein
MVYNATGRELLAAFKFKGNLGAGQYLVNQAQMAMPEGWSTLFGACEDPVIVPVPLHGKRLRHRGFNQSEFIANRLGRTTSSTVLRGCLIRNRETHTQVGLTANQRRENVRGAFEVPEARKSAIMGRSALLVDDLMTTGSTLGACGVALRRAGAGKVYAFTLFSTVKSVEEHSG